MMEPTNPSQQLTDDPAANGPFPVHGPEAAAEVPAEETPPPEPAQPAEPIVERIRRKVRTQAQPEPDRIQTLEERLLKLEELLTQRLPAQPGPSHEDGPSSASQAAPPVASFVAAAPVATVLDAPMASLAPPPAGAPAGKQSWWRAWFLVQTFNDFRLFVRMYVDPRYHMTWLGRLVPLAFLIFILLPNYEILDLVFFWRAVPVFGYILDKLALVAFSLFTVKVLAREMRRYQQAVPDVPDVLRWINR